MASIGLTLRTDTLKSNQMSKILENSDIVIIMHPDVVGER